MARTNTLARSKPDAQARNPVEFLRLRVRLRCRTFGPSHMVDFRILERVGQCSVNAQIEVQGSHGRQTVGVSMGFCDAQLWLFAVTETRVVAVDELSQAADRHPQR